MCLSIDRFRHVERRKHKDGATRAVSFKADRPLIIKKRVRCTFIRAKGETVSDAKYTSPYWNTPIEFGKVLKTKMGYIKGYYNGERIERGFHGFLYSAQPCNWVHRSMLRAHDIVTIYGVIPQGARYYIGIDKEVVSESIIYFKSLHELRAYYGVNTIGEPHKGGHV